ncbi:MAG: Carotenoid biosynthesis protein, partial [uncultured Solirubrobacteraceae bacterium]
RLLVVARRRALRGDPGVELRGLVRDGPRRLRGVVAARPGRRPGVRRRRRAGALRVDVDRRGVRQRGALAASGHGRGGDRGDGRLRGAGPARAPQRTV